MPWSSGPTTRPIWKTPRAIGADVTTIDLAFVRRLSRRYRRHRCCSAPGDGIDQRHSAAQPDRYRDALGRSVAAGCGRGQRRLPRAGRRDLPRSRPCRALSERRGGQRTFHRRVVLVESLWLPWSAPGLAGDARCGRRRGDSWPPRNRSASAAPVIDEHVGLVVLRERDAWLRESRGPQPSPTRHRERLARQRADDGMGSALGEAWCVSRAWSSAPISITTPSIDAFSTITGPTSARATGSRCRRRTCASASPGRARPGCATGSPPSRGVFGTRPVRPDDRLRSMRRSAAKILSAFQ